MLFRVLIILSLVRVLHLHHHLPLLLLMLLSYFFLFFFFALFFLFFLASCLACSFLFLLGGILLSSCDPHWCWGSVCSHESSCSYCCLAGLSTTTCGHVCGLGCFLWWWFLFLRFSLIARVVASVERVLAIVDELLCSYCFCCVMWCSGCTFCCACCCWLCVFFSLMLCCGSL